LLALKGTLDGNGVPLIPGHTWDSPQALAIVIGGVEGLAEREWPGRRLRVGGVVIHAAELRGRCIMTTFDPDTLQQDRTVLRRIFRELGGRMALDCAVVQGGLIREGDPVAHLKD